MGIIAASRICAHAQKSPAHAQMHHNVVAIVLKLGVRVPWVMHCLLKYCRSDVVIQGGSGHKASLEISSYCLGT